MFSCSELAFLFLQELNVSLWYTLIPVIEMKKIAAFLLPLLFLCYAPQVKGLPTGALQPLQEPRYLAITFDDGPKAETTARLLEGLEKREVQATFFLIGEQLSGQEELVRQMFLAGHQIGIHTENHVMLSGASEAEVNAQIWKVCRRLNDVLEIEGDWWLRPPYGLITAREAAWIKTPMIQWTIDPEDWRHQDADQVAGHIAANSRGGDIILLHDIYPTSVDAALTAIDVLQAQGYTFVTVRDLFYLSGVTPEPGILYMSPRKTAVLNTESP